MPEKDKKINLVPSQSFGISDLKLLFRALEFSALRHKNQFRKGIDKLPYINHPIQVAGLLVNEGNETDTVLLCAAILHDVIEDTVETADEKLALIDEIGHLFGAEVLSLTLEVTDDKALLKEERKRLQIEHANSISEKAKKLKLADKILNVRDITYNPPQGWPLQRITGYFDWAEKVVEGLRGANPSLERIFDIVLGEARKKYLS